MIKTYWAAKAKVDPAKIYSVSIMPCTAKKFENGRDESMYSSGYKDVDVTLTTRELARMIKQAGIDFLNLPDSQPDSPLGPTRCRRDHRRDGRVMKPALRTTYFLVTKEEPRRKTFCRARAFRLKRLRAHQRHRAAVAERHTILGNIATFTRGSQGSSGMT
jgi:NADH-quinone oxidoreductase subunit G